jgi:hypothetical protein
MGYLQKSAVSPPDVVRSMLAISICSVAAVVVFGMGIVVGSQVTKSCPNSADSEAFGQRITAAQNSVSNWQSVDLRRKPVKPVAGPSRWTWATDIWAVSSQWSDTQWSAQQVVGAQRGDSRR